MNQMAYWYSQPPVVETHARAPEASSPPRAAEDSSLGKLKDEQIALLDKLSFYVGTQNFLKKLEEALKSTRKQKTNRSVTEVAEEWDESALDLQKEQQECEEADKMLQRILDDYVIVDKEVAVEAMAAFIAAYIARLPQACKYDPVRLQEALNHTFTDIRRQRWQALYYWGGWLYKGMVLATGAVGMLEHTWLLKGILNGTLTVTRSMAGIFAA